MYTQLVAAANGDLKILQVSLITYQVRIIFMSTPSHFLLLLIIVVWYAVVLSQKDIIETINKHPNAGWTAGHNPALADYTVNINTRLVLSLTNHASSLLADLKILLLCTG
jgi:hypothetical protein